MVQSLEGPDKYISLARAAQLSGLHPGTLRNQVLAGKLKAIKLARNYVTTRRWLHDYVIARTNARGGRPAALPDDYVAPK
jgi:hypothetical protein